MLRSDRLVDVLASLYGEAEARLTTLVESAMSRGALGTARYRRAQIGAVATLLSQLQDKAIPEATQAVADAYQQGVEIANGSAPASAVRASFTGVHSDAVNALADALTSRLNGATVTIGRRVEDIFRREGARQSALTLLQGSTVREGAKALERSLRSQGYASFTDKAGREWGLRNYAEMVIRTTTREAATEATVNRLAESGISQVRIVGHANPCPICKPYVGKEFSLIDEPDHPRPPIHPRCRCVLTAAPQITPLPA